MTDENKNEAPATITLQDWLEAMEQQNDEPVDRLETIERLAQYLFAVAHVYELPGYDLLPSDLQDELVARYDGEIAKCYEDLKKTEAEE